MDNSKENTNFDPRYDAGSGVTPVAVGAGTAALGTIGVSHLMHREGRVQKNLAKAYEQLTAAQEKRDGKVEKIDGKLKPTDRVKKDNYESAVSNHTSVQGEHRAAANMAWDNLTYTLEGPQLVKVELDTAKGELKYLEENIPHENAFAKEYMIKYAKAKIKAVEQVMTDAQTSGQRIYPHTIDRALERLDTEFSKIAQDATDKQFHDLQDFGHKFGNEIKAAGLKARGEANPALHAQMLDSIPHENYRLNEAAERLKEAEKEWLPRRDKLYGGAQKGVTKAEQRIEKLVALDAINTEKGFLHEMARPVNLYREAGSGTRFGLLATAVTLGTAAYGVTRAITAPKREAAFTDNVPAMDNAPIQR